MFLIYDHKDHSRTGFTSEILIQSPLSQNIQHKPKVQNEGISLSILGACHIHSPLQNGGHDDYLR